MAYAAPSAAAVLQLAVIVPALRPDVPADGCEASAARKGSDASEAQLIRG
jgi:hypothetical protein